jgi:hypothetical protein
MCSFYPAIVSVAGIKEGGEEDRRRSAPHCRASWADLAAAAWRPPSSARRRAARSIKARGRGRRPSCARTPRARSESSAKSARCQQKASAFVSVRACACWLPLACPLGHNMRLGGCLCLLLHVAQEDEQQTEQQPDENHAAAILEEFRNTEGHTGRRLCAIGASWLRASARG